MPPHGSLAAAIASAIVLAGAALTTMVVNQQNQATAQDTAARFNQEADHLAEEVARRFEAPALGLQGLKGLFAASEQVSGQEFERFLAVSGLAREEHAAGFIAWVARAQMSPFVQQHAQGAADFRVWPNVAPGATHHAVIQFVQASSPDDPGQGLDLASVPVWQAAADQSAALGTPLLSAPGKPAAAEFAPAQMLYLMPVYRQGQTPPTPAARMAALQGWVYVPVAADKWLAHLDPADTRMLLFSLALGAGQKQAPQPLFSSASAQAMSRAAYQTQRDLLVGGQSLLLEARSTPAFEASLNHRPARWIGWTGALLSLALAGVAWLTITARSRARALAEGMTQDLDRLARVVRRTSNAVIITDLKLRITWVNEGFTRMYGFSLEEAQGRTPGELLGTPATDPRSLRRLEEAARLRQGCRVEVQNRAKDGRLLWIDTDVQINVDAQGQATGFIEIAQDVTTQKETALRLVAALHENEGLLNTVRQHAYLSVTDAQGVIVDVNQAFCAVSRYARQELLGRQHQVLNSGLQPKAFWTEMWQTISAGKPWRGQVCNRAADGSLYWMDSLVAPVRGADGQIERYVSIGTDISASKLTEQALRANEQFLDHVGRMAGVGGWRVDLGAQGAPLSLADEVRRQLGLPVGQALSARALLRRCDPAARWQLLQALRVALHRREGWDVELPLLDHQGQQRWMRVVGEVVSSPDGHPTHLVGAAQDVSRRRELEAGLRRTNNLLTGVVQNLPCGLAVFTANRSLLVHNEAFGQLVGVPLHLLSRPGVLLEDIARHGAEVLGLGSEHVDRLVARIVADFGQTTRLERDMPGGRTVEVSSSPMPGGGVVRTYVDVTERNTRAAEVRRADALLRTAIDTLDEAFVVFDADDRLVLCNDRYRQLFATSADLFVPGNTFEHIIRVGAERGQYAEAIGRVEEWVAERLAKHRAEFAQTVMKLDSGRWLRVIERRMPDGHVVGFRLDITDLMNATEAARSALQAKSQFLANMSHEIRTPLNAILGMLRLLRRTPLSPRQNDYASKTDGAARALLALVNDILDFSKIEAGKMVLDPQPFQPWRLVDDLSVLMTAQLSDGQPLALSFDIDPALPDVLLGDAMRLLQILTNLGGNAIKFTPQGDVRVVLTQRAQDEHSVTLGVEVRDTGIGIAPENLQRIFDGFSQAETSTTRRFGGTGLGLAISRHLVQMMGSDLHVDSVPGHGSSFHFQITLARAQGSDLAPGKLAATATAELLSAPADADSPVLPQALPRRLQGMRVLLVEDNANNRQVARELLEDEGAVVTTAVQGQEGVETVLGTSQRFDAVLMDVQMPVMDGLTAARRIRADQRFASLPIIALSANVAATDRQQALASGMNDHLGKPFDLNELVHSLQRCTGWRAPEDVLELPSLRLPPALAQQAQARGIRLQEAMDRVLGRTTVYQRMLDGFAARRDSVGVTLRQCLQQGQREALGRELHALKGLAAMLGAEQLSALAAEGEARAAHIDEAWLQTLLGQLAQSTADLQALAEQLPAAPALANAFATGLSGNGTPLNTLLDRLTAQLSDADMAATDTFEELRNVCAGTPGEWLAPLAAAMGRLDFDAAGRHARRLREQVAA